MIYVATDYLDFLFFIYGLAFFISGYTILFQASRLTATGFAKEIRYFGLFFLLHGLADWGPVFHREHSQFFSENILQVLDLIHIILLLLSYYFLFVYALNLLSYNDKNQWQRYVPKVLLIVITLISIFLFSNGHATWYLGSLFVIRYFIGVPATLLTAWALKQESKLTQHVHNTDISKFLKVSYITFIILGVTFLVSNKASFFPANIINGKIFLDFFGFPIQVIRLICAVIITAAMVHILDAFQKEFLRKYKENEKQTAILEERERIGQDIHDGTMQSLFGIGLRVQYIEKLLAKGKLDVVEENLKLLKKKVDEAGTDIRSFILDLKSNKTNSAFLDDIKKYFNDFQNESGIQVIFDYGRLYYYDFNPELQIQVSFIIKEALNNVRKHSGANLVKIIMVIHRDNLEISIKDNGKGFQKAPSYDSFGLSNIKKRVEQMKGVVNINSKIDIGTEVSVIIPIAND